jgi:hypothetical protein
MNLYNCKVGDVVLTGDSYGMDVCVCIKETHFDADYGFDVVTFLDMTDGGVHKSGGSNEAFLDQCYLIQHVDEDTVSKIKKAWNITE